MAPGFPPLTLRGQALRGRGVFFEHNAEIGHQINPTTEEYIMPEIMTTKEVAKYLKLHEITICKYAAEGKIPAIRIGRVWRFDKEAIDKWIGGGQKK